MAETTGYLEALPAAARTQNLMIPVYSTEVVLAEPDEEIPAGFVYFSVDRLSTRPVSASTTA
ncbi:hypothetical protein [Corynebacterium halotolerans]|uniref:hypothetical protein n=1 Tax=Corynebacterium halotolerans TaxID=225326 RepID=UPI0011EA6D74|nr:hypothetical protein [Corynebacterium halotolerans]